MLKRESDDGATKPAASDGSARAEYALPVAACLASAAGGTLILLQVYQVMPSECVLSKYATEAAQIDALTAQAVSHRPKQSPMMAY